MVRYILQVGSRHKPLLVLLTIGLLVRVALLSQMNSFGLQIVDEDHYFKLAESIFSGLGLAWGSDTPTSIRPPLYPGFVALVWTVIGEKSLWVIRIVQIVISLFNVVLLYFLGRQMFSQRVALWAAGIFCFYPSIVAFNFFLLTEVLFTFFLTLFVSSYLMLLRTGRPAMAVGTGCVLGLAALTRSILWPFPLLLCPLAFLSLQGNRSIRFKLVGCLFLGYLIVVAPWAVRNTNLQGVVTIVNTMGGITLLMGNYEHTPLNRAWDPTLTLRGEKSIYKNLSEEHPEASNWTEGQKEKWAKKTAINFILEHPVLTVKRSLVKFGNFWGLERTIIGGFQLGYYQPPQWFAILASVAIPVVYVLVMVLACLGVFFASPADKRIHWVILLIIFFVSGLHALVFGHSRYHLPLMPFIILYAASALSQRSWTQLRESLVKAAGPLVVFSGLLLAWGREILVVDASRIKIFLTTFF